MVTNGDRITNDKIYDLINASRLEQKSDIKEVRSDMLRLEGKFDNLEAGRLTRAEANIQELRIQMLKANDSLKQNQATMSLKFLVIQTIAYIILFVLLQAVANKVFK